MGWLFSPNNPPPNPILKDDKRLTNRTYSKYEIRMENYGMEMENRGGNVNFLEGAFKK